MSATCESTGARLFMWQVTSRSQPIPVLLLKEGKWHSLSDHHCYICTAAGGSDLTKQYLKLSFPSTSVLAEQAKQRSAEASPTAASLAASPLKEPAATLMDVGKQASLSRKAKAPLVLGTRGPQWSACIAMPTTQSCASNLSISMPHLLGFGMPSDVGDMYKRHACAVSALCRVPRSH